MAKCVKYYYKVRQLILLQNAIICYYKVRQLICNVICGVLYRQHNSPESFLKYLEETIDKFSSTGNNLCLLRDFNLRLQKIETCNYSRDFLLALQSCYLIPTIDKPSRVHKNSASLIDNIFVNNPE